MRKRREEKWAKTTKMTKKKKKIDDAQTPRHDEIAYGFLQYK